MSERRLGQRALPPIKQSAPRQENEVRAVSNHRESTNVNELHAKIKPDESPRQPLATMTLAKGQCLGHNSSIGQRGPFQRHESLPELITSGCYQPFTYISTRPNAEDQRQNTDVLKAPFPSVPFRLSIASEYDLNTSKGLENRNQKHPQVVRSTNLACALPSGGYFNTSRRSSYVRDEFVKPAEDLTPRSLYEMQLRYKNLIKLNRHVKFKNSQVLRGERIRKPHTLPGIRAPVHADFVNAGITGNLELLAVLSVKQANETEKEPRSGKQSLPSTVSEESDTLTRFRFSNSDNIDSQEAVDRRSMFYENRKKLNKRKALFEKRDRQDTLNDVNERMLITQALRLDTAQCTKSKPILRELKGIQGVPLANTVDVEVPRPTAMVTISGGCGNPLHKSIKITLPDCNLQRSTVDWAIHNNGIASEEFNANNEIFKFDLDEEDSTPNDKSAQLGQAVQIPHTQEEQVSRVTKGHSNELLVAQETDVFTDDSFSEVNLGAEFQEEPQISEADVSSETEEEVNQAMGAVAVDIKGAEGLSRSSGSPRSIEAPCTGSGPSSHSVDFRDFLAVPVGTVTRCVEVLSLGNVGGSGAIDIPEIRMICATPLPPGSPD